MSIQLPNGPKAEELSAGFPAGLAMILFFFAPQPERAWRGFARELERF